MSISPIYLVIRIPKDYDDRDVVLGYCLSEAEALSAIVDLKQRQTVSFQTEEKIQGLLRHWELDHPRPRTYSNPKDNVAQQAFGEWARERHAFLKATVQQLPELEQRDISDGTGLSELHGTFSYESVERWKAHPLDCSHGLD